MQSATPECRVAESRRVGKLLTSIILLIGSIIDAAARHSIIVTTIRKNLNLLIYPLGLCDPSYTRDNSRSKVFPVLVIPFIKESIINFNQGEGISKQDKTRQYYTDNTNKFRNRAGVFERVG